MARDMYKELNLTPEVINFCKLCGITENILEECIYECNADRENIVKKLTVLQPYGREFVGFKDPSAVINYFNESGRYLADCFNVARFQQALSAGFSPVISFTIESHYAYNYDIEKLRCLQPLGDAAFYIIRNAGDDQLPDNFAKAYVATVGILGETNAEDLWCEYREGSMNRISEEQEKQNFDKIIHNPTMQTLKDVFGQYLEAAYYSFDKYEKGE